MTISVVLADDHAVVRDGLKSLLNAQADIRVVGEATNGQEAVREVARLRPAVAVLDVSMPELNGIEATRRIQGASPATRVVILSMYATGEHIFQALRAGAVGYLLKESAGAEVVNAVRAAYGGRRYLSQRISDTVVDSFLRHRGAEHAESPLARLSAREREVLQLVVEGHSSAQIAQRLLLSPNTVDTYRSRLMEKLGVDNLPGLVKFAIQHGLTPLT
jgi:two-component system, NarL family, response regulator NreC